MGPSFRKRTSVPGQPSGTAVQAATDGPGDATSWFQQAQPWFRRSVVFVLVAIALFQVAEWLFLGLRVFLGLLFLAWLFAISMEAVVAMLERRGVRRGLATGLVMLTLFLSVVVFLTAFGALLVTQLTELVQALPRSVSDAVDLVNRTVGTSFDASDVTGSLRLTPERIQQLVQTLTPGILGIVSSVLGVVFQFFTLLLFAFYMSAEMPKLRNSVASRFPARQQQVIVTVWAIAIEKAGGYVVSRFLLAGLSALLTGAFLAAIGVPYWLPLAIWTGLVSQFIPTIGTYLAIALPAVIALAQQPIDAVWVIAFGVAYQQVENYFFSPRITARTISIHPAVAFGSVIVGAALFGPLGALVSIPVVAAIQAVVDTYGHRYDLAQADTEKPPLPTGPGEARPEPQR